MSLGTVRPLSFGCCPEQRADVFGRKPSVRGTLKLETHFPIGWLSIPNQIAGLRGEDSSPAKSQLLLWLP